MMSNGEGKTGMLGSIGTNGNSLSVDTQSLQEIAIETINPKPIQEVRNRRRLGIVMVGE